MLFLAFALAAPLPAAADEPDLTREAVIAAMAAYGGESSAGIDRTTLAGKLICGYQGWFAAAGDGSGRGWRHYPHRGQFRPGSCTIDLWPDVAELDDDEKFATPFRHSDGRTAYVFSSFHRKTVLRHFEWMKQYGIDGAFVQRFGVETVHPKDLRHCNTVLAHCREGANRSGRGYAVMYDLSGLPEGGVQTVIDDWKLLVDRMKIGRDEKDPAYFKRRGKPVVAVWGVGFDDGRKYSLSECERLISFLKSDPRYGGCTVMAGVPSGWRTLDADSVGDPALHRIIAKTDIVSPWTVGRYASLQGVEEHARRRWRGDLDWCRERDLEYLPVAFPGFSWHNNHPGAPTNQIPRLQGSFLWRQLIEAKRAGASMVYLAMFDEMDEGTAIFKCTNDPPVGASPFVTFDGLPSDHYLWLAGVGGKLLRGQIPESDDPPNRDDDGK
ncbi:MAG TPA: glycoside hydrolase family 71/99-like protein [Pirellulales bacterium]|nr:glycoside hydrolase family 71/99-like protein [Pirellulales bacterium]